MRRTAIAIAVASTLVAAAAAPAQQLSYPSSIVVLGHSGATGAGSDPAHPFRDTPANSWATGTNPAVDSVYSRLLAVNPSVRGHTVNLAEDGARVTDFAAQVLEAMALIPKPDLVLVQIGANDVQCDGHEETHYGEFKAAFADALGALSAGLPNARIFVVSEWTTLPAYLTYLKGLPLGARLKHAGKGLCQIVDSPSGRVVPSHAAYLAKAFAGYEAQLAAVCKRVPHCRYDGGAAHRIGLTAADMTIDQNHLTIQGLAKLAAVEWAAMSGFVR